MSEVRVNNIVDYGGKGAPTFDNGAVISGVSRLGNQAKIGGNVTITSGGINVSGVTTAATLSGNLTGDVNTGFVTATSAVIGSGVTINAGGLNITGVVTATTFEGSGTSLTGVAMTIAPLVYNPDVNDTQVTTGTGIGITFDHRILAGSGNVTLSIANAGAAGTTVENFGVGSSVTIAGRKAIIDPTSDLNAGETYHINYPSGAFTNTGGDVSYVGTAYTFGVKPYTGELFSWGMNTDGVLGQNQAPAQLAGASSPIQIPAVTWRTIAGSSTNHFNATKTDGTLWTWGSASKGSLGQNTLVTVSSPVQVPGTTWSENHMANDNNLSGSTKTDGTLWMWGQNSEGQCAQNSINSPANHGLSSPVQVPGTTWSTTAGALDAAGDGGVYCIKTDGTAWVWGRASYGSLGLNQPDNTHYSSPVQLPGTTWKQFAGSGYNVGAVKTDGTMWTWGWGANGRLGHNQEGVTVSSPTQVPGTTWKQITNAYNQMGAIKTDGTLWMWGYNDNGQLGQNDTVRYSSPVQIPGTTWAYVGANKEKGTIASKTDGTLWSWGSGTYGQTAHNDQTQRSSPVQVPGTTWGTTLSQFGIGGRWFAAIKQS